MGCRHNSVDSYAPSILLPQVQVRSTLSMLLSIYIDFCHVDKTKINKKSREKRIPSNRWRTLLTKINWLIVHKHRSHQDTFRGVKLL